MPPLPRPAARAVAPGVWLVGLIVAAYAASLGGGFLWDDDLHITANPTIIGPLGLREIWTTARANYFPLVLTNFWVQHALWDLHPLGYRIVTLLAHAGAGVLLWRVLLRLRVPGAWLGAALWALHPVQVESVAWICELKNTQSAVAFLAAVLFWVRWIEGRAPAAGSGGPARAAGAAPGPRGRDYALALTCALLAILSKPSTVMLPVALVLATGWLRRREPRGLARGDALALAPFFALSAVAAGWTIWEQKYHSGAVGAEWSQSGAERVIIAGRAIGFYLGQLLWPAGLSFLYPRWTVEASRAADYLPAVVALAALAALGWGRRRWPAGWFAGGYFVALLFPVLGFFDVYFFRYSFVGDHFQYLASMGPLALAGAGIAQVFGWRGDDAGAGGAGRVAALPSGAFRVAAAVLVGALGVATARQALVYRSSETLWEATVERNPGSATAWAQLGAVHERAARHGEAVACFERALRIDPRHPEALNHLGCEHLLAGRVDAAIAALERAIAARPGFTEAQSNLAVALVQAGRAAEALPQYEAVLRAEPGRAATHAGLGLALAAVGRADEAVAHFREAIEREPAVASAHNDFGATLAQLGRLPEALAQFDEAVRLDPGYAAAQVNRGGAFASLGRLPEAAEAFARAAALQPDSEPAHRYLAQILQALGREDEARPHRERAEALQRAAGASR